MSESACIACGAETWAPRPRELVTCRSCGFVRAARLPSPDELARLYDDGYFSGGEYADYAGDAAVHRTNARRRLATLSAISGGLEGIYEIGCAYGFFLEAATHAGLRAAGIDVAPAAVRYAHDVLGQQATLGAFTDAPLERGAWPAFCLWDTIEHLAHPEDVVARIAALLPRGGWCFATTGDIGSRHAQRAGEQWRMIHPPTHLQYFSRDSLRRFLARHGLEVVDVRSAAVCRSVHGTLEGLRRFGHGPARGAAAALAAVTPRALAARLHFWLDLGDIVQVSARRT